jgi:hypothetical protein
MDELFMRSETNNISSSVFQIVPIESEFHV